MTLGTHQALPGYGLGATSPTVAATGGVLMSLAPVPVVGPFIAIAGAVTELLAAVGIGAGCGNTCIQASNYANQAESLLKQNLAAYMALPTPRPQSLQQAALANFAQVWNGLVTACSGVSGVAGQHCISDRQQGACHFKDSNGNCWNWFIGYHDPIANDTQTYNDSVLGGGGALTTGGVATSSPGATVVPTGSGSDLLMIAGVMLAALFLVNSL